MLCTIPGLRPWPGERLTPTPTSTPQGDDSHGRRSNAPVITRDELLIDAPAEVIWNIQTDISAWPQWQPEVDAAQLDGILAVGSVFHWETAGLEITSTVQEVDPPRRIVWSDPAQGITAVHVWELIPTDHGVLVHTEESWDGEPVRAQTATLQQALDASLRDWLHNLKRAAEQAGR
jgi:uncharacterized protein YndB with AHSA1/START domain